VVEPPSSVNIDVRQIRLASHGIGATQRTFAGAIGVPVKTVRNWEQGRRKPTGPALVLLTLIQRDPWIVFDVVNGQHVPASGAGRNRPLAKAKQATAGRETVFSALP